MKRLIIRILNKITQLSKRFFLRDEGSKEELALWPDCSNIELSDFSEESIAVVNKHLEEIYTSQAEANDYSDALRRDVVQTFEMSINELSRNFDKINYLEIGSNKGLSMSIIAIILKKHKILGKLVSIDPYFDEGYREGLSSPWGQERQINITKKTKEDALKLYQSLDIDVELMEMISREGMSQLALQGRKFHLIYIDGSHEGLNPTIDFGIANILLNTNGIIMLDDWYWPDVKGIKELCDKGSSQGYGKIQECWKVAAYRVTKIGYLL